MHSSLKVQNFKRRLPHRGGPLSFELNPGEVMGLVGPHASGKSQLLRCLAGDWMPRGCTVEVQGRPLAEMTSKVSWVPAQPGMFPEMTCWQFLEFFARSFAVPSHYRPYLCWDALNLVGLGARAQVSLFSLSHSDCHRLALARAMVSHPAVVLIQGLFDRVESDLVSEFAEILQRLRQTGVTLVVSALSLGPLMGLCSHLCVLVTDQPLICGEISGLLPRLVHLKMMQVQFLSGFAQAVRLLQKAEGIYALVESTTTPHLVRFLFDGQFRPFEKLLEDLQRMGCSIVSVAEDHSFLGR